MYIVGDGVSSPAAINGWIPEWPKGTDCKSAANCFGGSNPPPSIIHWRKLIFAAMDGLRVWWNRQTQGT